MNRPIIIPTPRSFKSTDEYVTVGWVGGKGFELFAEGEGEIFDSAVSYLKEAFNSLAAITQPFTGDYRITLKICPDDERLADKGDEAYAISVTKFGMELVGATQKGAYYAAVTAKSLLRVSGARLTAPVCEIVDHPNFSKRGVFIEDRFNDFMELDDWKSAVDYYSEMKMNTMVVGVYGCWYVQFDKMVSEYAYLPLKTVPELYAKKPERYYSVKKGCWVNKPPRLASMYSEDYFSELLSYAKSKNVEVLPLFNSLGHNTILPRVVPEISARDKNGENKSYGMCLSSPKTIELMTAIHREIIEHYLLPAGIKSIHLGLDESNFPSIGVDPNDIFKLISPTCECEACSKKRGGELIVDYAVALIKNAKACGMENVYVYHDAFYQDYGESVNNEITQINVMGEALVKRFKEEDIYDVAVIDWWNYSAGEQFFGGKPDNVKPYFRSIIKPMSGYEFWSNFSDNTPNIDCCARLADKLGFEGMVSYTTYERMNDFNYRYLAESSWLPTERVNIEEYTDNYFELHYPSCPNEAAKLWRSVRLLVNSYRYGENVPGNREFITYAYSTIWPKDYPRDQIGEIFAKIQKEPERYLGYMKELNAGAERAVRFFEENRAASSEVNENLKINFMNHKVATGELLALHELWELALKGELTADHGLRVIDELICDRRGLMLAIENTRLATTRHLHMRFCTTNLQYLLEYKESFEKAKKEGTSPSFDPLNHATDRTMPVFDFLR